MPQINKGNKHTTMQVESLHVLDIELAKRVGIVGPYDFVNHGLRGYTSPDRLPTSFRPSLSACDALMVAAELNMRVDLGIDYVEVEWAGDNIARVNHNNERTDKLRAMCTAVMKTASHILEIPQ